MKNFIGEVPAQFPANVIAPVRVDTNDSTIFSLAVYVGRKRKPLPLGKLTIFADGGVEAIRTQHNDSPVVRSAWRAVLREYGIPDGLNTHHFRVDEVDE